MKESNRRTEISLRDQLSLQEIYYAAGVIEISEKIKIKDAINLIVRMQVAISEARRERRSKS